MAPGKISGLFVDDSLLHPYCPGSDGNRLLDYGQHMRTGPENIDQVHSNRDLGKGWITGLSQNPILPRIDGYNSVSRRMEVSGHPMTGPLFFGRQPDHRNGLCLLQNGMERFKLWQDNHKSSLPLFRTVVDYIF